jgi:C-terminal processing protease CtpA/Prc
MKRLIFLIPAIIFTLQSFPQDCDCESNFKWAKKTFEENDAGFQLILDKKGQAAYDLHNQLIMEKIKAIEEDDLYQCMQIIRDWLSFFRKGHIRFSMLSDVNAGRLPETEFFPVDTLTFKEYIENETIAGYEGIFDDIQGTCSIGIKKEGNEYIGFIMKSTNPNWRPGDVKLKIIPDENSTKSVYYTNSKLKIEENNAVKLLENTVLQIGKFTFSRIFPQVPENKQIKDYLKSLGAREPFLEELDENTLYLRIPSFDQKRQKPLIDTLLSINRDKISNTKNLIIDIRDNGGGSDNSYSEILPFLYTNPIRKVVLEFLSTKISNQQWLEFAGNAVSEKEKMRDKNIYEDFEKHLGEFIAGGDKTWTKEFPVVHPYPENVGLIINGSVACASEEFLMEAKQSFKVKLFGVPSAGALDVSNMWSEKSPCRDFELHYTTSKSSRLPVFSIDDTGLQPDFLIDDEIPCYQWVDYVKKILD